ncbi:hypothetical protein LZ32DRAFT_618539 [Colletotrichum eremochloae]|nr:hypothetical protein LZ32DRAFT_618539 [Colletotrichum eremochloae]
MMQHALGRVTKINSLMSKCSIKANKEVMGFCGANFASQFFMLSCELTSHTCIDPKEHLAKHGILPMRCMPNVDTGLRNHAAFSIAFRVRLVNLYRYMLEILRKALTLRSDPATISNASLPENGSGMLHECFLQQVASACIVALGYVFAIRSPNLISSDWTHGLGG